MRRTHSRFSFSIRDRGRQSKRPFPFGPCHLPFSLSVDLPSCDDVCRYGWTGDAAITADEAVQNFDMPAFFHNWLRMVDDVSQNGAVPCWVPGGVGARSPGPRGSCDASWGSAFPSVAHALYNWNGDVTAAQRFWPGLTRFIDNEYARTANGSRLTDIFTTWGDWQPAGTSPANPTFVPEPRVDKPFVSGFSFVNDVGRMAEMASAIGGAAGRADAAKYTNMYAALKVAFHKQWYNAQAGWYADGGQTAQVLALVLDRGAAPAMMTSAQKAAVLRRLVQNIEDHGNHSTSGISGFRYVMDVLSDNGRGDLAYALMTQTSFPSFGYQILNAYEPATTVWELWQSDVASPRMNSRNHIMFGGPGSWLHTYIGGISNAPGSVGYQHVLYAPPAALIAQAVAAPAPLLNDALSVSGDRVQPLEHAPGVRSIRSSAASEPLRWVSATKETGRGAFALSWSLPSPPSNQSCDSGDEGSAVAVNCTGVGIGAVIFADYGVPVGNCGTGLLKGNCTSSSANLIQQVSSVCDGQESCSLECSDRVAPGQFMGCIVTATPIPGAVQRQPVRVPLPDPCNGARKYAALRVRCSSGTLLVRAATPPNSIATTALPLLGGDSRRAKVTENGAVLWQSGKYIPGVPGVTGAEIQGNILLIRHGSGIYDFRRWGY